MINLLEAELNALNDEFEQADSRTRLHISENIITQRIRIYEELKSMKRLHARAMADLEEEHDGH